MVSLIVALALTSILILTVLLFFQVASIKGRQLIATLQVMNSLEAVEGYLRKEFSRLEFAPFCPGLIPRGSDILTGIGFSREDRDQLQRSVTVYYQQRTKRSNVDLQALKGQGAQRYSPVPVRSISGIVEGSDMFFVTGLLWVPMVLKDGSIEGEVIEDLVGIRRAKFYLTDCHQAVLVEGQRNGETFVFNDGDYPLLAALGKSAYVQVYMIKEYFGYLQIDKKKSFFVLDMLDGQAFVRIPLVLDMSVSLSAAGVLSVDVVAGIASRVGVGGNRALGGAIDRIYQNVGVVDQKEIRIRFE